MPTTDTLLLAAVAAVLDFIEVFAFAVVIASTTDVFAVGTYAAASDIASAAAAAAADTAATGTAVST